MTEPTAKDHATRLLTLRVVKDWVAAEEQQLRASASAALVVGERVPGVLDPADADNSLLGFVQKVKGRESTVVTDQATFLAWCEEHTPGEVVTRREVRSSFVTAVLAAVKSDGGWHTTDGELIPVDGVETRVGEPTLNVKPSAEADGLIRDALAANRLALGPVTP